MASPRLNGTIPKPSEGSDKSNIPTRSESQEPRPMLIDMNIWYPEGAAVRSAVSETGQYPTPHSGRPLPRYVVPPRHWPGINSNVHPDSTPVAQLPTSPSSPIAEPTTPDRPHPPPVVNPWSSFDPSADRCEQNRSVQTTHLPSDLDLEHRLRLLGTIRGAGKIAHYSSSATGAAPRAGYV